MLTICQKCQLSSIPSQRAKTAQPSQHSNHNEHNSRTLLHQYYTINKSCTITLTHPLTDTGVLLGLIGTVVIVNTFTIGVPLIDSQLVIFVLLIWKDPRCVWWIVGDLYHICREEGKCNHLLKQFKKKCISSYNLFPCSDFDQNQSSFLQIKSLFTLDNTKCYRLKFLQIWTL